MKAILILISAFLCSALYAQNPPVEIATWKNHSQGAYTIIHDDYGDYGVVGIQNYADTMHHNRGLKFTFGAITSACEGNPGMYTKALSMINDHGHEIINHSHSHTCAVGNEWCTTGLWAEPATEDFDQEIDYSSSSIFSNTGFHPRYFIYPYDQFNTAANDHLKANGYIGSRTGTYDGTEASTFAADAGGFFRSAFIVDAQTVGSVTKAVNLNYWVDFAIQNDRWVNRELHNVGSSGWGHVTVAEYRDHLNYLKQKVDAGELWVGTISEVLTYQMQKNYYSPSSSYNNGNQEITVTWNSPSYNVANWLSPLQVKSPITLLVNLTGYAGVYDAFQNGQQLTDVVKVGNELRVNCYPHIGPVVLKLRDCNGVCISSQPVSITHNEGENAQFEVVANTNNGSISYQWYFQNSPINGATSSVLNLTQVSAANAGSYYVVVSANSVNLSSNTVTLTVNSQQPFSGRIAIPGRIEMENFDVGGQGISWNESSSTNQGDGGAHRSGPVDVEICDEGGYNVGYITDGEWLEYSVTVAAAAYYDFSFRVAASNVGPQPQVSATLNGSALIADYSLPYTGGWQTWQSATVAGVYLSQGEHVLRFTFPKGNANLNYVDVVASTTLKFEFPDVTANETVQHLHVYPNPAEDQLHLTLPPGQLNYNCQILNVLGESMLSEAHTAGEVRLSVQALLPGTYFLKVESSEGAFLSTFQKR